MKHLCLRLTGRKHWVCVKKISLFVCSVACLSWYAQSGFSTVLLKLCLGFVAPQQHDLCHLSQLPSQVCFTRDLGLLCTSQFCFPHPLISSPQLLARFHQKGAHGLGAVDHWRDISHHRVSQHQQQVVVSGLKWSEIKQNNHVRENRRRFLNPHHSEISWPHKILQGEVSKELQCVKNERWGKASAQLVLLWGKKNHSTLPIIFLK